MAVSDIRVVRVYGRIMCSGRLTVELMLVMSCVRRLLCWNWVRFIGVSCLSCLHIDICNLARFWNVVLRFISCLRQWNIEWSSVKDCMRIVVIDSESIGGTLVVCETN